MDAWLDSAERIGNQSVYANGGTYLEGVPWRFVAHTTEAIPSSLVGAKAMAARHPYPPHLWAWPDRRWLGQTVPLDRSAAALVQPRGEPAAHRTNKARAIQVEIIGEAADTPQWSTETWEWLGEFVLAPVIEAGYPINLGRVAPLTGNDGYGLGGKVRMGWPEWLAFDGLCAHSNVPGNDHWDIGDGRLDIVAAAAARKLNLDHQEDDMKPDERQALLNVEAMLTPLATKALTADLKKLPVSKRATVERTTTETYAMVKELFDGKLRQTMRDELGADGQAGNPDAYADAVIAKFSELFDREG